MNVPAQPFPATTPPPTNSNSTRAYVPLAMSLKSMVTLARTGVRRARHIIPPRIAEADGMHHLDQAVSARCARTERATDVARAKVEFSCRQDKIGQTGIGFP